jgi:ABC-type multidrug transport system fused ATPase/permease subunit
MPSSTSAAARLASIASAIFATVVLLLPALWNRFPILEYDTGGYLARWFEGYLVPSRSTTYGMVLFAGWPLDFWPVVVLQAAAAVWVIGLMLRIYRSDPVPVALIAIVAALALTTALPWLASELLTDIFAGAAVLGFHALLRHGDRIGTIERLALIVFVAFAVSTHSGTYAVVLALALAALAVSLVSNKLVPRRGVVRAAAALTLGAAMLVGTNYAVGGRLAWTPGGYGLTFARMLEDGIVTRYLNDHCPDSRLRLCPYRQQLPLDADDFLWNDGVFDKLGRFAGLDDEMRRIVLESLRDYPTMQIEAALRDTAHQLTAVATGYGVLTTIWHTYGIIERYTPSAVPAMRAARQQRGEIGFTLINDIDVPVAWLATALLPILAIYGLCNAEFADLGSLAATLTLALMANAVFCAVISHYQDRYGSRLAWIAVLTAALAAWRAAALARRRLPGINRESVSTI